MITLLQYHQLHRFQKTLRALLGNSPQDTRKVMSKFSLLGKSVKRQRDKSGEDIGSVPRARSVVQATYVSVSDRVYKRVDIQPDDAQQIGPGGVPASHSCASEQTKEVDVTEKLTKVEESPPTSETSMNDVLSGLLQWLALDDPSMPDSAPSSKVTTHPTEGKTRRDEQPALRPIPPPAFTKKVRRSALPSSIILRDASIRAETPSVPRVKEHGVGSLLKAEKPMPIHRTPGKSTFNGPKTLEKKISNNSSDNMSTARSSTNAALRRANSGSNHYYAHYRPPSRRPQLKVPDTSSCHKTSATRQPKQVIESSCGIGEVKTPAKTKIDRHKTGVAATLAPTSRSLGAGFKPKAVAPPVALERRTAAGHSLPAQAKISKLSGAAVLTNVSSSQVRQMILCNSFLICNSQKKSRYRSPLSEPRMCCQLLPLWSAQLPHQRYKGPYMLHLNSLPNLMRAMMITSMIRTESRRAKRSRLRLWELHLLFFVTKLSPMKSKVSAPQI